MARATWTASIALFLLCPSIFAALAEDVTPAEAERRALADPQAPDAERWLKIAADGGLRDAQALLGERYLHEGAASKNLAAGIDLVRRAATQGSAQAQSMLGWAYGTGTGVEQNASEAVKWLEAAARQENGYALWALSGAYYRGDGVAQDSQLAKRLLLRSAELGDARGLTRAWRTLLFGKPDERDSRLGMYFLYKEASTEEADAAYMMGREYLTGRDVPRDLARATMWLERAVSKQHTLASLWLSELHAKGIGVKKDPVRAEQMLQAALRAATLREKNQFSWTLSVAEDEELRNSALAIRVLEPALAAEKQKPPQYLDTLAASYAENGQFDKAVATQLEAIQTLRRTRPAEPAPDMEQRLELYRAGKAYREDRL
ncbi:MAG TPA: tetratricopeptide repeat protein [Steroidobacteraceae bacterium]